MLATKFPTLISFFELPSCFVICWGWLKTRGLFAMCDMRRFFASEIKLQIAWKIVRKKWNKKNVVNISFLKENWKLDQIYCAWLIKWWIISGAWWYWVSIWWYWLVLGQYKLVLLDIRWYMVSKGLVCLYILEKVEIWSGDTDAWHTDSQTTENRATQLVSSIKHKLSHAIWTPTVYIIWR